MDKNKKVLIISSIALLCLIGGIFTNYNLLIGSIYFATGEGTVENPYQITTLDELQNMNVAKDSHFILMNDIDASETSTWNEGEGFRPIGERHLGGTDNAFSGTFDGQGYNIDGLFINELEEVSQWGTGLFGGLYTATITNISITDAEVIGHNEVGILAGDAFDSTIKYCRVNGIASSDYQIAGNAFGYMNGCTISDCYSSGQMNSELMSGTSEAGGFIAYQYGGTLNNCYTITEIIYNSSNTTINGGFSGKMYSGAVCTDSYWCEDLANVTYSASGTALSSTQMKNLISYENWDFENVWDIHEDVNNGYPFLRIFDTAPEETPVAPSSGGGSTTPIVTIEEEVINDTEIKEINEEINTTAINDTNSNDDKPDYLTYIFGIGFFISICIIGYLVIKKEG